MSVFVGAARHTAIYDNPDRPYGVVADEWLDFGNEFQTGNLQPAVSETGAGYASEWWPSMCGLSNSSGMCDVAKSTPMQMLASFFSGANGRFGFAGIARDSAGNVLASATIRCYRTSDGLPVADPVTSDANGYFLITTPYYPDAHFLTVHKTTPGPWGGASYDNLVGG